MGIFNTLMWLDTLELFGKKVEKLTHGVHVKKAMEKIETARKELQAGKKFADVAGKYTEDPSGTDTGGALGWFGRGRMVKPFEDAAFGLEKGAVSEPVRTQFGFHLIEVEDKKPAYYRELPDVSGQIRERLAQDRAAETLQDRLDQVLEMLLAGETLQAVAKSIGLRLEVRKTAPFSRQQGPLFYNRSSFSSIWKKAIPYSSSIISQSLYCLQLLLKI